jgi:hypothetical protein
MFQKPKPTTVKLNSEIERLLSELNNTSPDSDEYKAITKQLSKLHALKVAETPKSISPDTWLLVAANLVGIIMVLKHEQTMLIPKTAMSIVKKIL